MILSNRGLSEGTVSGSCTAKLEFEFLNWVQAKATSDCLVGGGQPPLKRWFEVAFFPPLINICQQTMENWVGHLTRKLEVAFTWSQFGNANSTSSDLQLTGLESRGVTTHKYLVMQYSLIVTFLSFQCLVAKQQCDRWNTHCCAGLQCMTHDKGFCTPTPFEPCACFPVKDYMGERGGIWYKRAAPFGWAGTAATGRVGVSNRFKEKSNLELQTFVVDL